ncbi:hypothetical protein Cni_G29298 [Canna indica]|uniref:Trichome birefringence-like C-terminal domain-containing protein n=1 Tax=Canna indica TaxID=4628 RepID=A0AAQ3L4H9_9LILI|nr:hypothetical protein Cni_G29298 [Canna indica]
MIEENQALQRHLQRKHENEFDKAKESLLCMLSMDISKKSSIYEVNGNSITKHTGFLVFKFRDYNCTLEYYRSQFLVPQGCAPAGVPKKVKTTLKLDTLDWTSNRWNDVIFSYSTLGTGGTMRIP